MNKAFIVFCFSLICFISSCRMAMDIEEAMIYYENNSDIAIHVVAITQYADTILPYSYSEKIRRGTVESHSKYDPLLVFDFLKDSDSTTFFIINNEDVLNHSLKEIADNRLFLCIYILSKSDISILSESGYDKTIPYPPTDNMKSMNIFYFSLRDHLRFLN